MASGFMKLEMKCEYLASGLWSSVTWNWQKTIMTENKWMCSPKKAKKWTLGENGYEEP